MLELQEYFLTCSLQVCCIILEIIRLSINRNLANPLKASVQLGPSQYAQIMSTGLDANKLLFFHCCTCHSCHVVHCNLYGKGSKDNLVWLNACLFLQPYQLMIGFLLPLDFALLISLD